MVLAIARPTGRAMALLLRGGRGGEFAIGGGTLFLSETIAAMREAERIAKDPSVKGYTGLDEMFAEMKT